MAEYIPKLQELQSLPTELHWFCNCSDLATSPNKNITRMRSEYLISEDLDLRRDQACECLALFGFGGEEALPFQNALGALLDKQLARCDLCVMEYYKSRQKLQEKLRQDYDDDHVTGLIRILNERDITRIRNGLSEATQELKTIDPSSRNIKVLGLSSQLALFEALCSEAFLADENSLGKHFQEPFELVQKNRFLIVTHYVPAATTFLFDTNHTRRTWATHTWSKYKTIPTEEDFDFAIRDPLLRNMKTTFEVGTDPDPFQLFWHGIGLILNRLDQNLVTHSLRALEMDIYRLALDHLQYKAEGFRYLLQVIQKLLELAPGDFWDAMGTISPTTVIEQIFNGPQYDRFIAEAKEDDDYNSSALKDMLSWIKPFMASLQTHHQARACRSLGFQLLEKLQVDRFPLHARIECKRIGLATLAWTLTNCNKESATLTHTGRVVSAETLSVVSDYIKDIINMPSLPAADKVYQACAETCLKIIKVALALECKSLRTDQETLKHDKGLPDAFASYSLAIWDVVVQHLNRGNVAVARAVLVGINDLTGLEKFKTTADEAYTNEKGGFNMKFGRLTHFVCQILERINDFHPRDLDKLFRHSDTATALVASLFSPDANLYEAGVNLIKSISGESARREAIGHLLRTCLETTLNAFSWAIRRIARNKTFASCPRMLRTSADVLAILCDSQNGLLRTRTLSGLAEIKAVENFWEHQWEGLRVIYESTEEWGQARVADSNVLKEFCRDTMQLSELFFDQYSVFANAIENPTPIKQEYDGTELQGNNVGKELLQHPAAIMEAMVKWLRLRDIFLVDISVKLTKKVLGRLTEQGMIVAERPCNFLHQVLKNGPQAKTHLQPQEKAEIARALEENLGHPIAVADVDGGMSETLSDRSGKPSQSKKKTKATTIDLDAWRSKAKTPQQVIDVSDNEFGDSDLNDQELLSISQSAELMKKMQMSVAANAASREPVQPRDPKSSTLLTREQKAAQPVKSGIQSDADRALFREKREKEKEAKKRRDLETLALVKKKASVGISGQTLSEGSALGSIGVKGKDHAPKASSMMVSSGSESNSEDDIDRGLFGGAPKPARLSAAIREHNAKIAMPPKVRGPVKKARQARSARDMRARLAPDLAALHKTILSWEFFHNGDFPPGSERDNYSLVSSSFKNPLDYQNTFEPLLILEAWQGFLKSKEEGNFKVFEIKIANRMTVDAFLEVSTTMSMAEGQELGISEADIVLMSKGQSPAADAQPPHCLSRVFKISRKKGTMDVTYRANVGNGLVAAMVPNSILYAVKISSITPLEREYGSLLGLKYFDLCDEIIRARPSPLLEYSERQIGPLAANYEINVAQAKAVKSAIDNDAFTLIQGPPGSGKTKTIVTIIGALLTGSFVEKGIPIDRPQMKHSAPQRTGSGIAAKKLLVCAPSNAAVDELVMRFKSGVKTLDGSSQQISVIRLGRSDAISSNVMDVTLEELVTAKLSQAVGTKNGAGDDVHKIMMAHKAASEELNALRTKVDEIKASGKAVSPEQDHQFEVLKRRKQQLSNRIDAARDSGDMAARDAEMSRRRVQQELLDGAHVICATLSGSGHEMFQGLNIEFETVIIDEAAQSIELSALIPLKYGCSKCILVGDPKQLPPTVLSREAARFQYEQSLFVRMQANHPDDVHLLDTQYRMHPEISVFPSNAFYDGRLLDGPGMAVLRARPWHQSSVLGPYRFFDVQGQHQSAPRGHSLINIAEIEVALKLFDRLLTDCKGYDFQGKVGIITPYKSQLRELRSRFTQRYGESVLSTVEFNTTDAFQGRENEVIIFSCVRASMSKGIGFLSDIRRMNVGITRAKCSLWVLGNSQSLTQGEFWGRLIQDAKVRDRYTGGDLLGLLRKPILTLNSKVATMNKVPSRAHTPATSTPSSNDHDIDMPDAPAPTLSGSTDVSRRDSAVEEFPMDSHVPEDAAAMSYRPAGGSNGLNVLRNCSLCGSFAHVDKNCDKKDILDIRKGCYRCGCIKHTKDFCTAQRCITCGKFGHLERNCTSPEPLPSKRREWIVQQEAEHKAWLQRVPEKRRKFQLGDHDPQVPIVRSTSSTPAPGNDNTNTSGRGQQTGGKRKRELSPPAGAPKEPKLLEKPPRPNPPDSKRPSQSNQPLEQPPNGSRGDHCNGLPVKPVNSTSGIEPGISKPENFAANAEARKASKASVSALTSTLPPRSANLPPRLPKPSSSSSKANNVAASAGARAGDEIGDRSRDRYNGAPDTSRDPRLQARAETIAHPIIKAGESLNGPSPATRPPPLPNNVRPPKKKKEVDPFIRPKRKP